MKSRIQNCPGFPYKGQRRQHTVSPLLSSQGGGGLFISSLLRGGGLIEMGGGHIFNLEKRMVSVVHKNLEYKVEKLKYKKVGGLAAEDQKQIRTTIW